MGDGHGYSLALGSLGAEILYKANYEFYVHSHHISAS